MLASFNREKVEWLCQALDSGPQAHLRRRTRRPIFLECRYLEIRCGRSRLVIDLRQGK